MSATPRGDPSNPCEGHGLRLVEVPQPHAGRAMQEPRGALSSLSPMSFSDWVISLGFGGLILAYLAGIGLAVRWLLHWLFGG